MKLMSNSLLTVFLMAFITVSAQTQNSRPNIVVILADDLGYADVGFNRGEDYPADRGIIPTPHIDALADQGIIGSNVHVAHPFCGPSRAAIMTGMSPHRIGAQYNLPNDITCEVGVAESETFFSTLLQDANYHTAAYGKWHLGFVEGKYQPLDRGFDEFFGFCGGGKNYFSSEYDRIWYKYTTSSTEYNDSALYNTPKGTTTNEYQDPIQRNRDYVDRKEFGLDEYLTDILTDEVIDFIDRKANDTKPFFTYICYNAPHTPLQAPQDEIDAFKIANPDFENLVRNSTYITNSTPVTKADDDEKQALIDKFVEARITYATMVTNLDSNIGRLVDKLESENIMDSTVIIFLSDNGGYTYSKGAVNYPLEALKGSVDEGGHRVPFFVHWPAKIKSHSIYPYQISSMDLYPTLVNLAGGTLPSSKILDGVDFMDKLIAGENARPDEALFILRPQNGFHNAAIISYPYRIVKKGGNGSWKLYNVNVNPQVQLTGTVGSTTADAIITELQKLGADWVREFKDVKPAWFDNERGDGHPHRILWFGIDNAGNTAPIVFPNYDKVYGDATLANSTPAAIDDVINKVIAIYPNPSSESFNIRFNTSIENLEIELLSTSGQIIKSIQSSHVSTSTIDANNIASGMYVLRIKADDKRSIEKVIKL